MLKVPKEIALPHIKSNCSIALSADTYDPGIFGGDFSGYHRQAILGSNGADIVAERLTSSHVQLMMWQTHANSPCDRCPELFWQVLGKFPVIQHFLFGPTLQWPGVHFSGVLQHTT